MADLVPIISFPGIQAIHSCVAHDRHGISPATIILNILPQPSINTLVGDLTIGTVGGPRRTWRDCLIDASSLSVDDRGFITSLILLDRRWRWSYPLIEAYYNQRNKRGEIIAEDTFALIEREKFREERGLENLPPITDTERLPSQLCEILLRRMGEDTPDNPAILEDVPNDLRPEVNWDGVNAAMELQRLCDLIGCRIILQPDNRVAIRRLGEGAELPDGPVTKRTFALDPSNIPSSIRIASAPTTHEWDFELRAVVKDKDEIIKAMKKGVRQDSDNELVTIIPKVLDANGNVAVEGWDNFDPEDFRGIDDKENRLLALETAYRWYSINFPVVDHPRFQPQEIANYDFVILQNRQASRDLILKPDGSTDDLPSFLRSVGTTDLLIDLTARVKFPIVFGQWFDRDAWRNTPRTAHVDRSGKDSSIWPFGFSIDFERGIVQFSRPIYRIIEDPDDTTQTLVRPARIKLRIAFNLKIRDDRAFRRRVHELKTDSQLNTEPLTIVRNDLIPQEWYEFQDGRPSIKSNYDDIDRLAAADAKTVLGRFESRRGQTATYIGIVPVTLDGALHSAVYELSQSGIKTTVQRNQDRGYAASNSYDAMRRAQKIRALDSLYDKNRGQNPRRLLDWSK